MDTKMKAVLNFKVLLDEVYKMCNNFFSIFFKESMLTYFFKINLLYKVRCHEIYYNFLLDL